MDFLESHGTLSQAERLLPSQLRICLAKLLFRQLSVCRFIQRRILDCQMSGEFRWKVIEVVRQNLSERTGEDHGKQTLTRAIFETRASNHASLYRHRMLTSPVLHSNSETECYRTRSSLCLFSPNKLLRICVPSQCGSTSHRKRPVRLTPPQEKETAGSSCCL